mmetsp:Transcript_36375/g.113218  ORF Transcript_36375/g.113218 Transcript_36375/m.113218 type:complete len:437 (-) Transcript_36375:59-1369(-)
MSDASVSSGHGAPATLQCLVTPKLTFNLLRKRDWKTVEDISQEELRAAFRSRFPVPLRLEDFTFRPAVPESTEISPETEQLVYKITAKDVADDRVMLRLLQELEKAYSERHKKSLEEAKAEMLASTVSFQVVVDELRQKHTTESDLVQRELGKLKTQLQQSQKRLFLLEQEKQQMGTSLKGLEADNRKLRLALEELRTKFNEFMGTCDSRGLGERVSMVAEEVGMAAAFKTQSVFDRLHQDALKRPARLEEMLQRYFGKPSKLWQAEDASRKGKPVSVVEGCFAEYPLRLWTKTPKEDDLTATSVSTSPEPAPPGKRLRAEPGASTHPGAACPKPLATAANTAAAAAPVGEPPSPGDAMRVASFLQHRRRGQSAGSTEAHGPNGSSLAPTAALAAGTSQRAFVQIPAASSPAGGGTADGGTFKRRPRPVLSLPALR